MRRARGDVVLRDDVACPPGAWNVATIAAPGWSADLNAYEAEWRRYERAIAIWNASPLDGLDAFLAYVFTGYSEMFARFGGRDDRGDAAPRDVDDVFSRAIPQA